MSDTSAVLPDPVAWVGDALAASGALLERDATGSLVLLPVELAKELGVPEAVRLVERAGHPTDEHALVCGFGAPALERVTSLLGSGRPVARVGLSAEPPRASRARHCAERFSLRNAPVEAGSFVPETASYLVGWFAWSAEADDRYDGIVRVALALDDLGEPDADLLAWLDPVAGGERFRTPRAASAPTSIQRAFATAVARAKGSLERPLAGVREMVARRLQRDHERIAGYFEALARDAKSPRRKIAPETIAAKLEHLRTERDAKLRALSARYRLRVRVEPVALLVADVPALRVQVRVRRRKLEGSLSLRLPANASSLDRLACSGCPSTTSRPAVCDDRLHVLCERCVPSSQGRPSCPACRSVALPEVTGGTRP
ncbi:hypothetical protein MYXO_00570 [Myxococcaceae bacterium]|nr:hypothetical protein MYXO_00570 [Myxococcaceae bacterium]